MVKARTFVCIGLTMMVLLVLLTGTAAATIDLETSTDYNGGEEESDQGIDVEVTISPVDHEITDTEVVITSTDQTFLDTNSFSRGLDPADADTDISATSDGIYEIDRLGPGTSVTIEYTVYPKDIKQESIEASMVEVEYIQQGQTLSDSATISADLSTSPWFRLVEERQRPPPGEGGGTSTAVLLMFMLVLVIALGGGGFIIYKFYLE